MNARYTLAALAVLAMVQTTHAQTPPTGGRGSGTVQYGTAVSLCAYLTTGTTCGPLPAVPNGIATTDGGGSTSISAAPFVGTSVTTPIIIAGSADASASPVAGLIRAPNATGTNIAGVDTIVDSGNGTGTGGSGAIQLKTAAAGSTGSTANTQTTRVYVDSVGHVNLGTSAGTAWLQLPAGTAAAGTAPLKFSLGPRLTTAETGAMELDSATNVLLFTPGAVRRQVFMGNLFVASPPGLSLTTTPQTIWSLNVEAGYGYIFEFNFQVTPSGSAALEIIPTGFTTVFSNNSTFMLESYAATFSGAQTTTASGTWAFAPSTQYGRIRFNAVATGTGAISFALRTDAGTATLDVGSYSRIMVQ